MFLLRLTEQGFLDLCQRLDVNISLSLDSGELLYSFIQKSKRKDLIEPLFSSFRDVGRQMVLHSVLFLWKIIPRTQLSMLSLAPHMIGLRVQQLGCTSLAACIMYVCYDSLID